MNDAAEHLKPAADTDDRGAATVFAECQAHNVQL